MKNNKLFQYEYMPQEVLECHIIMTYSGGVVSKEMYDKIQATIDKYPNHFPWEHKYKSIPKEVHIAYDKEVNGCSVEDMFVGGDSSFGGGLLELINNSKFVYEYKKQNDGSIVELFNKIFEAQQSEENEIKKQQKEAKLIWDKHYKKYELEYRP